MSTTTTPVAPQSEINEILNQTEIGSFIARYKTIVIGGVLILLVAVFAYGYYNHAQTQKFNTYTNELYAYTDKALKDFNDDKLPAADLVNGFKSVYSGKEGFATAGAFMVQLSDALKAKDKDQEAYVLLTLGTETIKNNQMLYFLRTRAAALAEDLGKSKEAMGLLEAQLKSNVLYMADKIYLDLGRLYMRSGDVDKAKSSFQWILDKGTEQEFKKMAGLYIEELAINGTK